jgi:hypothetical protein
MQWLVYIVLITLWVKESFTSACDPTDPKRLDLINTYIKNNTQFLNADDINLIKFIAGDCSPVVWLSGLYANKFQVQITNCTEINTHHPEIAQACGYDKKCNDGDESIFWISETYETDNNSTCFGHLAKLNFVKNPDNPMEYIEEDFKGFRMTFYGNTPKTKDSSQCGFGASCNLFDKDFYFGKRNIYGAEFIKEQLIVMGYQLGYSLFSIPVDWRRLPNDPYNFNLVKDAVDLAYNITNKPVLLISHSYGGVVSLNYIYSLSEEEKQKKIARYIALGPPLLGSNKVLKPLILGNDEFNIHVKFIVDIVNLYVSMENQKIMENGSPVSMSLMPGPFWNMYKNDTWYNTILARARVENKITKCIRALGLNKIYRPTVKPEFFKFLEVESSSDPSAFNYVGINDLTYKPNLSDDAKVLDQCVYPIIDEHADDLAGFKELLPFFPDLEFGCGVGLNDATCEHLGDCKPTVWDRYCRINFFIPYDDNMVEIKNGNTTDKYDLSSYDNIKELITKYGVGTFDLDFIDFIISKMDQKLLTLDHPGVPATIYYSSNYRTVVSVKLPENPKPITDSDRFVIDVDGAVIFGCLGGDGTVPAASLLFPTLKWALSEESKTNPVHFVEYCSNQGYKPQEIDFNSNQYLNSACNCTGPSQDDCSHSSFLTDLSIIQHMMQYVSRDVYKIPIEQLQDSIDVIKKSVRDQNCANLKKLLG